MPPTAYLKSDRDTNPHLVLNKLIRFAVSTNPRIFKSPSDKRLAEEFIEVALELQKDLNGPDPPPNALEMLKQIDDMAIKMYKGTLADIPEEVLQSFNSPQALRARITELQKRSAQKNKEDLIKAISNLNIKTRSHASLVKRLEEHLEKIQKRVLDNSKKDSGDRTNAISELLTEQTPLIPARQQSVPFFEAPSFDLSQAYDKSDESRMVILFNKIVAHVSEHLPETPDRGRNSMDFGMELFLNTLRSAHASVDSPRGCILNEAASFESSSAAGQRECCNGVCYTGKIIVETEKALARSRDMSLEESRKESRKVAPFISRMIEKLENELNAEKGRDGAN